jgi:glutathione peroxidase
VSIYAYSANRINGQKVSLSEYAGKVVLIVNTASKCGLAPQLDGLEKLYQQFADEGFVVLGFPSNQFANQEPGSDSEVEEICKINYGVTFPMFAKIDVNGRNAHPLYAYLKKQKGIWPLQMIKWNFTKFLIGRDGKVIKRYAPSTTPESITSEIERSLK